MRALEVSRRGLQDMLHPDELSPRRTRAALEELLSRPLPSMYDAGMFTGTELAVGVLHGLAGEAPQNWITSPIALKESLT